MDKLPSIQHTKIKSRRVLFGSKIRTLVWVSIFAIFILGLILPTDMNLVLASVFALNFGLMSFGLVFMYRRKILLSPPGIFFVTSIPFYTFGNIGDLTGRRSWILNHQGALDNYALVGILSSLGLVVYLWSLVRFNRVGRGTMAQGAIWQQDSARANELLEQCVSFRSVLGTAVTAIVMLAYLSWNYDFVGGYFIDVNSQFDKYLAGTMYSFVFLSALLGAFAVIRREGAMRVLGVVVLSLALLLVLMMRSRSTMGFIIVCILGVCLTALPLSTKYLTRMIGVGLLLLVVLLGLGTVVKDAQRENRLQAATSSMMDNLGSVVAVSTQDATRLFFSSVVNYGPTRMAGFEFPASLMMAFNNGGEPMYGRALISSAIAFLPSALRPEGTYSERYAIGEFYRPYGFIHNDMPGIVLSTGLAEVGPLGVIPVFILFALWHSLLWKLACRSRIFFLAYLAHIPALMRMDLLWDSIFHSLRVGLVLMVALYVLAPLMRKLKKNRRRRRQPLNPQIRPDLQMRTDRPSI